MDGTVEVRRPSIFCKEDLEELRKDKERQSPTQLSKCIPSFKEDGEKLTPTLEGEEEVLSGENDSKEVVAELFTRCTDNQKAASLLWMILCSLFKDAETDKSAQTITQRKQLEYLLCNLETELGIKRTVSASMLATASRRCALQANEISEHYIRQGAIRIGLELIGRPLSRGVEDAQGESELEELILLGLFDVWSATRKICARNMIQALKNGTRGEKVASRVAARLLQEVTGLETQASKWKRQEGALIGLVTLVGAFESCREASLVSRIRDAAILFLAHEQVSVREVSLRILKLFVASRFDDAESLTHRVLLELGKKASSAYHVEGLLSALQGVAEALQKMGTSIPSNMAKGVAHLLGHEASTVRQACSQVISICTVCEEPPLDAKIEMIRFLLAAQGPPTWQLHEGQMLVYELLLQDVIRRVEQGTCDLSNDALDSVLIQLFVQVSPAKCGKQFELVRMSQQLLPLLVKVSLYLAPGVLQRIWSLNCATPTPSADGKTDVDLLFPAVSSACAFHFLELYAKQQVDPARMKDSLWRNAVRHVNVLSVLYPAARGNTKADLSSQTSMIAQSIVFATAFEHSESVVWTTEPLAYLNDYLSTLASVGFRDHKMLKDVHEMSSLGAQILESHQLSSTLKETRLGTNAAYKTRTHGGLRSLSQSEAVSHMETAALAKRARTRFQCFFRETSNFLSRVIEVRQTPRNLQLVPYLVLFVVGDVHGATSQEKIAVLDTIRRILCEWQSRDALTSLFLSFRACVLRALVGTVEEVVEKNSENVFLVRMVISLHAMMLTDGQDKSLAQRVKQFVLSFLQANPITMQAAPPFPPEQVRQLCDNQQEEEAECNGEASQDEWDSWDEDEEGDGVESEGLASLCAELLATLPHLEKLAAEGQPW